MKETHLSSVQAQTDTEQLADAAVATWHDVWIALSPVIGAAGVVALFQRSVFLRMAEYPWLANVIDPPPAGQFNSLRRELSLQKRVDAAAANAALLQSLAQILGNLIGSSLTTRLLQPVWEKHGRTTQDKSAQ
ncbi:MAG: hypothetical protein JWO04_482 [Gammaproteobacteria bacterium]|nr:hypothetical protein [Gammaproteobacteria bacterium]